MDPRGGRGVLKGAATAEVEAPVQAPSPAEDAEPFVSDTVQLEISGLTKLYAGVPRVNDISLRVRQGSVLGLLGPSGCGKTTTLRMIAGLETPDAGTIRLNGGLIVDVEGGTLLPPHRRNMGMVFQSYAIWPHMTVYENVAYPLKIRRVPRRQRRDRVERVLRLVDLVEVIDRPSANLSGGQQQRVALARALVYEPSLLLLDEPLSNLDTKLRQQMRDEIRNLQQRLGITIVFVTHDQDEAMSLADTLAVMKDGVIEQHGEPRQVYDEPTTPFVRDFLGDSVRIPAVLAMEPAGMVAIVRGEQPDLDTRIALDDRWRRHVPANAGDEVILSCRIEDVMLGAVPASRDTLICRVRDRVFVGDHIDYLLTIAGRHWRIPAARSNAFEPGATVALTMAGPSLSVWPA